MALSYTEVVIPTICGICHGERGRLLQGPWSHEDMSLSDWHSAHSLF